VVVVVLDENRLGGIVIVNIKIVSFLRDVVLMLDVGCVGWGICVIFGMILLDIGCGVLV